MIPERCTFCRGSLQEGKTEFIARVGGEIVVVRDVPQRPTTLSSSATTPRVTTTTSPSPGGPSGSRPTRTTPSAKRSRPGPTPFPPWHEGDSSTPLFFPAPGAWQSGRLSSLWGRFVFRAAVDVLKEEIGSGGYPPQRRGDRSGKSIICREHPRTHILECAAWECDTSVMQKEERPALSCPSTSGTA